MAISKEEVEKLLHKYKTDLDIKLTGKVQESTSGPRVSVEYDQFKRENLPKHFSVYEKLCKFSGNLLKIKPKPPRYAELEESIRVSHLAVTPVDTTSFAILMPLILIIFGASFSLLLGSMFFTLFFAMVGAFLIIPLNNLPSILANSWRMKASNQMVLSIFYVVTYMRHTSNLELAVDFAAKHLAPPLSIDFKKVLWDVETESYPSVIDSLGAYLDTWKKYNMEFIESFHLVISSLYESSDERRIGLLDKALSVILDETFEKMLHYAHNLKSPITMLHMLGIIMPILGLVVLPLVVSFMKNVSWYHISMLYNVLLPIGVYFLGKSILSKRPTGYGDTDISENPEYTKYKYILLKFAGKEIKISPAAVCFLIGIVFFIFGVSPLILHAMGFDPTSSLQGYRPSKDFPDKIIGPFGVSASLLSLGVPLGFGLGFGIYFTLKSRKLVDIRARTKSLESEFASALFQLGAKLGDGMPPEIAFGRVAETIEGTSSGTFFSLVNMNVRRLGMSVEQAIFDPKNGALLQFPSNIIESSMKVLIESAKKGPRVAATALLSVSRYIKEMHKVDERLKDLLADVISSMKSQINFLTPVIAGIVIGITSMITNILGKLTAQIQSVSEASGEVAGSTASISNMFGDGFPTFYFQIIVGLYVVQIIYVLSILSNGIENGADKLGEIYWSGKNLVKSTLMYCIVSLILIFIFHAIASNIMSSLG